MRIFVRLPLLVALALSITCAAAVAQEVRDAQDPISAATINAADVSTLAANNGALDRPYIFPPETAVGDPDSTILIPQ